jgi:hypothetical protein
MYILHPHWLSKHGIVEKGIEVGIATNFTQPGFKLTFPNDKSTWTIAPNRLIVESTMPTVNCGEYVAKVLKKLPETPLQALGSNVHYEAPPSEMESLATAIVEFPKTECPQSDETVAQRTFHVGVKHEDKVANLQLALTDEKLELSCNVHESLENRDNANVAAITAARRFFDDRVWAKSLARHFFGTAIET